MKVKCKYCEQEFEAQSTKHKYCSTQCVRKAFNARHTGIYKPVRDFSVCKNCGQPKEPERMSGRIHYCEKCRDMITKANNQKSYKKYRDSLQDNAVCLYCGKVFKTNKSNKKYCQNECRLLANGRGTEKEAKRKKAKAKPKLSLAEVNARARQEGLTYAQYVAKYNL